MPAYFVKKTSGECLVCRTADEAAARELAEAATGEPWSGATVENISTINPVWTEATVRLSVSKPGGGNLFTVQVSGKTSLLNIGNAIRDELNKLPFITNATYTSASRSLLVARDVDGIGDRTIKVDWTIAGCPGGTIDGMVTTYVHQRTAGDYLALTFSAASNPRLLKKIRTR